MPIEWTEQDEIEVADALFRIYDRLSRGGLTRYVEFRGSVKALIRMIEAKFGSSPAWVGERLVASSSEQFDHYVARFVTAGSIDEIFAD